MTASGTFTLDGTATGGAKVYVIDTETDPSTVVGTTTTAADGTWSVDVNSTTTIEAILEYEDPNTGEVYKVLNKPYVAHESAEPAAWSDALHRYNHNEGSGTTIADTGAAGTLADATISGATWNTTNFQYEGASVSYDGVDDSSTAPNRSTLTGFTTGMSLVTWLYPNDITTRQDAIDGPGYAIRIESGNWQVFLYHDSDGSYTRYNFSSGPHPTADAWNRIGFRWTSGNHIDLLLNGSVYAGSTAGIGGNGAAVNTVLSSTNDLYFSDPSTVYNGLMDGPVMVWDRALTDQEVQDDYNAFGA